MTGKTNKVVVLACSGIGKVYGTIARETTYELMDRVRPGVVVTTCLPLLVIADHDAMQLVTDNPVITIDGCPKSCAQKTLEAQGVKAAKTYQAINFYKAHKEIKPDGIVELDENGRQLAAIAADELAQVVDELAAGGGK
ncbi:MAG: putative zinc-binding protein [Syntrophales bacterium]